MIIIARYTPNIYDTQNSHVSINLPFFHTIYLGVSVGTNKTLFFDEPVSQWTFLVGIEGYVTCQVQALGAWDWCARWNFVCSAIDIVQHSFMYSIYVYIQGYYVCWWCIVLNHISCVFMDLFHLLIHVHSPFAIQIPRIVLWSHCMILWPLFAIWLQLYEHILIETRLGLAVLRLYLHAPPCLWRD